MPSSHSTLRHPRKTLFKASSFEVLSRSSSSEDEDIGGGVRLLSPDRDRALQRPASSGVLAPRSSSTLAFQVGSTRDDDVFTESSRAAAKSQRAVARETEDVSNEPSSPEVDEETDTEETDKEDTSQAIIPHDPNGAVYIDAQHIYPPSACIFAANLTQQYDDDKLEVECTKYFSQFGPVFIKIRRDVRGMPYAFCQFTCDAHAQRAQKHGQGAVILGRPCRIEMAKAHSSYIIYKISGMPISDQEATDALGWLGEIAKVFPLDPNIQTILKLPSAIVVRYRMYDPKRDVHRAFLKHRVYRVMPYEPKVADGEQAPKRSNDDASKMMQYDRDRRSAYFGSLPLTMTEDTLREIASAFGRVLNVDLKRKFVQPENGNKLIEICFGFVEYVRPDSIDDVIAAYDHTEIDGYKIKVRRKVSREFGTPRRQQYPGLFQQASTRHRSGSTAEPASQTVGYAGTYTPPTVGHQGAFVPPGSGFSGVLATPAGYTGRAYHHSLPRMPRHAPRISIASAGPAPPESPDAASKRTSNPSDVKPAASKESNSGKDAHEAKAETAKSEDKAKETKVPEAKGQNGSAENERDVKGKAKAAEADGEDVKGKGKATETDGEDIKGKGKAAAASPAASETNSTIPAAMPPGMGYPMMSPYSPYGYTPLPSYMPSPMTPQGPPMMYGAYPGPFYTPYQDMYGVYPLMAPYGAMPPMETPTRHAGSSQTEEQNSSGTKKRSDTISSKDSKSGKKESKDKAKSESKPEAKGHKKTNSKGKQPAR